MPTLLTADAHQAFRKGHYHTSRNAYCSLGDEMGEHLFKVNIELCARAERRRFLKSRQRQPDAQDQHITYCVPILNRLDDLKKTLLHNLDVLAQFHRAKLIVNIFDRDEEAYRWTTEAGRAHIETGLLSVNRMPPLNNWHFCWAKNSFTNLIDKGFYSSLDGDNYLTVDEVLRSKQAIAEFGPCIIHHFSGTWGDGTCGRVTLPAELYRQSRYTDELFPRQFDEFSLILNALNTQPELPIISRYGVDVFEKSPYLRLLRQHDGWDNRPVGCDLGQAPAPENPKVATYTKQDQVVRHFGWINGYYCLIQVARTETAKQEFRQRLKAQLDKAVASEHLPALAQYVFHGSQKSLPQPPTPENTSISMIKCCDEGARAWVSQQASDGTNQFLIIEFGQKMSDPWPIMGKNVIILRPIVGDSELFSTFWLACLKALYNISHTLQTPHLSASKAAVRVP